MSELVDDSLLSAICVEGVSPDAAEHKVCYAVLDNVSFSPVAVTDLFSGLNSSSATVPDGFILTY